MDEGAWILHIVLVYGRDNNTMARRSRPESIKVEVAIRYDQLTVELIVGVLGYRQRTEYLFANKHDG